MNPPDLKALQRGDTAAWDAAFDWLWPTALEVVQLKLQPFLPGDVEDVAMEVMEELVEKVRQVKQVQELKPLTASIAHNRAVSRLRRHFSDKRCNGHRLYSRNKPNSSCVASPVGRRTHRPIRVAA